MSSPTFTIIVPVYNTADYLPVCLDSIINQTYRDIEIILVNDGSTDGSAEICDECAKRDSRVVVIHKDNEGKPKAVNLAIQKAKGDFILLVDSDDYIDEWSCQRFFDIIKQQSDVDVISANVCQIANNKVKAAISQGTGTRTSGTDFLKLQLHNNMIKGMTTYIYKKEFLTKNHLYVDEQLPICHDLLWILSVLLQAQSIVIADFVYYYHRNRVGSLSHPTDSNATVRRTQYMILSLQKIVNLYNTIDDQTLKALVMDVVVIHYFRSIKKLPFYQSQYKELINKPLLKGKAHTIKTRTAVCIFCLSPSIYYFFTKFLPFVYQGVKWHLYLKWKRG